MSKLNLFLKRKSPEILVGLGIVNSAAAIVLACIATKNLPKVLDGASKESIKLHKKKETLIKKFETEKHPEISAIQKKINKLYIKTGCKVACMYLPSVLSFGLSVASIVGSHNIMKGRNAALAAAFTTVKGSYDAYRQRVRAKFGDEIEENIYNGETVEEVEETDSDGNKVVKKVIKNDSCGGAIDPNHILLTFGSGIFNCQNPELTVSQLEACERFCNEKLHANGFLILKEVYDMLGIPTSALSPKVTRAACLLGWIYDPKDESRNSFVDFGIHDRQGRLKDRVRNFQMGYETEGIWLEFNTDGDIITGEYTKSIADVEKK